jgi:hypothetical protein
MNTTCRLVKQAANKNCALDPAPTWIVKQFVDELSPFICCVINSSIRDGVFPSSQKCAIVTPILKKETLDPSDLNNYRPVSNLSFLSKIFERVIYEQVEAYLRENNLMPERQSSYRRNHSTETVVLDVLADAYAAADAGKLTFLGLLDQSSAFDVVDHDILLERLRHCFGISGTALNWLKSYLSGRTQYISYHGQSDVMVVKFGVPQGSVLGPLLFLLYTSEIFALVEEHGFRVHGYADDLQIYEHHDQRQSSNVISRFSNCVDAVKDWMARNRLRLNPSKTEVIWLGSSRRLKGFPTDPVLISGSWITPSKQVRDLGVTIDSELTMIPHVNKLLGICYFHIRQLRAIRRSLTVDAAHALVRSLIHSRLDYCNSVLVGLPDYMINRLQSVLRSAARLVLQLPKRSHALERMQAELHWLVYPHRLYYKVGVISYKCLHGLAPPYLSTRLIKVSDVDGRSHLRSASDGQLVIPKSKTKTIGVRGFHISGPTFWNFLPGQLRDNDLTLRTFREQLKTVLFRDAVGKKALHALLRC